MHDRCRGCSDVKYRSCPAPGVITNGLLRCEVEAAVPSAVFTPDFVLNYKNGTTEVIEIKSKFTKKQSRDYTLRRRLFIDKYCRPRGWLWREIVTDKGR